MLDLETVTAGERETVRVFAVDLPAAEAKAWARVHTNLEAALGVPLDGHHLESFPADDLTGMGLAQFLIDGYGIAEADIPQDRTELDTAGPQLVLIRARAFGGAAASLEPRAPLVPLGAFVQAGAALARPTPSEAMQAGASEPATPPDATAPTSKGPLIAILIFLGLAIVLMAVLIVPKL